MKRAIVTPDKHFPEHDQPAINVVCKAIKIVKPDIYVDLGDTGEWNSFSAWKWKKKKKPPLEYMLPDLETDVIDVNKGMDQIDEALDQVNCNEKHFCEGNHDNWLNIFVEQHPYMSKYALKNAIKLKERGYKYHPMGKLLKIGKMNFYHGHHYAGQYHTANHLRKLAGNIMYGHHHDIQVYTDKKHGGPISACSIGCLKSLDRKDNEFCSGRPLNWAHGIAVVDFIGKDSFVRVIPIKDGKYRI